MLWRGAAYLTLAPFSYAPWHPTDWTWSHSHTIHSSLSSPIHPVFRPVSRSVTHSVCVSTHHRRLSLPHLSLVLQAGPQHVRKGRGQGSSTFRLRNTYMMPVPGLLPGYYYLTHVLPCLARTVLGTYHADFWSVCKPKLPRSAGLTVSFSLLS